MTAWREGAVTVVSIPARFTRTQEREWVDRMVGRLAAQDRRRRPSDEALLRRATALSRSYLDGRAVPTSVTWSARQGKRWGSCTTVDRTIRISDRLQGMPRWVLDYVLMHELAHLLRPGHDGSFWALVDRYPHTARARGFLDGYAYARGRGEAGPVLILSGSCSQATRAQVKHHVQAGHPAFKLDIDAVMQDRMTPQATVAAALAAGPLPLVYSSDDPAEVEAMQARHGREPLAAALDRFFGDMAAEAAERGVRRIVCAGGETSGAIVQALATRPQLTPRRQPQDGVTYAAKLDKAEAALDCTQAAELLARRVRAFNPVPGATMRLPGLADPVKVWKAQALPGGAGEPGSVLNAAAQGIDIATGSGVLRLLELQKAGAKRQPVDVFVRGWQPD